MKEKLYIGEATVATIFGVIVGPHALNWFAPQTWGNTDFITLEISRIVLVVQIFAVAVELPKKYMLRHWLSVLILLLPVMTFGWLISSVFIWKLVPTLTWIEGLCIAACVTATDPVLASAVVGKGKFARRVPGHLRNLLSAESGCNDGMAFPFAYLAINIIHYAGNHRQIAFHFIVISVLYECVFGSILGAIIGYSGRHAIKFAEKHNLIDRESFLSFYFVLALFCTGVGSIIGTDDLLVSFAAGTAFSWDGWFSRKTEESHVSNVIDLLINMSFFVYFGAIVPWEQFNNFDIGIKAWKLVILAILVLLFRRMPIMLFTKPFNPDIRTWREAFFCGHFGPIGVGAIFIAILCRAELESGDPTPLAHLPSEDAPHYYAIATIWPVTTFLVIASIVVHGSSIAVFTLGKRLNNMTITMSYTTGGNNQSWLSRLPRLEGGKTLSLHKMDTDGKFKDGGVKAKPAGGLRKRKKGEPVRAERPEVMPIDLSAGHTVPDEVSQTLNEADIEEQINTGQQAYQEGDKIIIEDPEGEVIKTLDTSQYGRVESTENADYSSGEGSSSSADRGKGDDDDSRAEVLWRDEVGSRKIVAYQLDDTIIVENEDGEIIRRYRINRHRHQRPTQSGQQKNIVSQGLDRTLSWVGLRRTQSTSGLLPNQRASGSSDWRDAHAQQDVEKHGAKNDVGDELELLDGNGQDLAVDDETMKKQLKSLLLTDDSKQSGTKGKSSSEAPKAEKSSASSSAGPTLPGGVPRNFLGKNEEEDEDEDEPVDTYDDTETEVERKRRLAALGILKNDDEDDEEEEVEGTPARNRNDTRVPPIAEEDEEEPTTRTPPTKIQWSADTK